MGLIVGFLFFELSEPTMFSISIYMGLNEKNGGWRVLYMGKMNEIW